MKKREHRKQWIKISIIVAVIYVIINCLTTVIFFQNYKNEMDTLARIAVTSEQEGIDIVTDVLKNKDIKTEQGKQLLEKYGYIGNDDNIIYQRFLQNVTYMACGTFLLFAIMYLFLFLWIRKELKIEQIAFLQIENILARFRENDFEAALQLDDEVKQEKIKYQLDALGHYMVLLKEEARLEKEGTKELVSDISHQLKTPVAALDTCFSVLLRENLSEEERKEFQVRCRCALDGLEVLLQSLLQISKMEAGLIQINREKLPLMETIIRAVNRVYPNAGAKEIEFVFDYDEALENVCILQDKKWLGEAFINVFDNAIKYSPAGSEVYVRIQKRTDFIRIEIEDNGVGIPKAEYHKIFQRFFRGSLPEVKEETGSGIGLFLSRKIIEQHGGTITVSSNLELKKELDGKTGSVFIIQLPDNTK